MLPTVQVFLEVGWKCDGVKMNPAEQDISGHLKGQMTPQIDLP